MAVLVPSVSLNPSAGGGTLSGSPEDEHGQCLARLETLAGDLADQRLHLAELYERLAQAEREWQVKQAASTTLPVTVMESDSATWPAAATRVKSALSGWNTALNTRACVARRFRMKFATAACSASSSLCGFPRFGQRGSEPVKVRQRLSTKVFAPELDSFLMSTPSAVGSCTETCTGGLPTTRLRRMTLP